MFRWKRGVLHALIPFALAIAGGVAILVWRHPADPEKLGEGVGRFAMTVFLAGLGVSYLAQTGKRKAALAVVAIVGVMAVAIATSTPAHHLREADRAPRIDTVGDGVHRLRHPTLGFSILRPPPSYHDAPQVAAVNNRHRDGDRARSGDAGGRARQLQDLTVIAGGSLACSQ